MKYYITTLVIFEINSLSLTSPEIISILFLISFGKSSSQPSLLNELYKTKAFTETPFLTKVSEV